MSDTYPLPPRDPQAQPEPAPAPAAQRARLVYENRICQVVLGDDEFRVLRTEDGHQVTTYRLGERGYYQACQMANSVAGAPLRSRPGAG